MNLELNLNEPKTLQFENLPLSKAEESLHERALTNGRNYKRAEAYVLRDIIEIDETKLYEKFRLTSTFAYCMKFLDLTEPVVYAFINVARKSRQFPELKKTIFAGELTVPKAIRVASVLTEENKTEWIQKAKTLSKAKLEKEVSKHLPNQKIEKLKPMSANQSLLQVSLNQEIEADLRRLQEVESQKSGRFEPLESVLGNAIKDRLERIDPVRVAARVKAKKERQNQSTREHNSARAKSSPPKSKRIVFDAKTVHAVNERDKRKCKARLPDGTLCDCGLWTQIHHIVSIEDGGTNDIDNLITLCAVHHRQWHSSMDKNKPRNRI
jgi:hypothetical protein